MPAQAIFLSYSSDDAGDARRICDALRAAGLEVWFDQNELRGGDAWDASIRRQIRECALFVPIISAHTNAREEGYFRREWNLAVNRMLDMADDKAFLLPIVIDATPEPAARVPDRFRERQWSRVNDEASLDAFARRVVQLAGGGGRDADKPISSAAPAPVGPTPSTRRRAMVAGAMVVAVTACIAAALAFESQRKARFVAESVTQVEALARSHKFIEAYRLAREVERAGGADRLSEALKQEYTRSVDVDSTPAGAAIAFRGYRADAKDGDWIVLGAAPLAKVRVPRGVLEWRATLPGRAPHVLAVVSMTGRRIAFSLAAPDEKDAGMVPVPEGEMSIGGIRGLKVAQRVKLAPYSIDRTEVTNRDYASFVQAGGYAREEFWKQPLRDGERVLGFSEAMARFKDATGRAGPATWKLGNFPEGEGHLPVRGISWYEASAYAAFVGKELPTIYHWYFADTGDDFSFLLPALLPGANFGGKGPRAAVASRTIGAFGAIDMAGNVREWVATSTDRSRYNAVGGSWLEVPYQYKFAEQLSGFDRPVDVGLRCMKRTGTQSQGDVAFAPVAERPARDTTAIRPVSDAEYAIYERFFERSRAPLDVRIESTDATPPHWTRLKVSYATGYGGERMNAYLYLPKNATPPYQGVIFMHGANVFNIKQTYDEIAETPTGGWIFPEMLVRGGRAMLQPVWKGSFERSGGWGWTRANFREHMPRWVSELRQSVRFLRTRPEVDAERIGYFGASLGAMWGPNLLAMEPQIKAAVLLAGGLEGPMPDGDMLPPEIDAATYAPRTRASVLMLNGRSDIRFPYETSQVPMFQLLGSPPGKKKHKTYPGGHSTLGWFDDMVKDTHDWFDEQFGVVRPAVRRQSDSAPGGGFKSRLRASGDAGTR